jgi:hypothetical protein
MDAKTGVDFLSKIFQHKIVAMNDLIVVFAPKATLDLKCFETFDQINV